MWVSLGAQAENTKITTLPGNHQFIQFTCNTYYHFHKKAIILTQIDMFCLNIKVKSKTFFWMWQFSGLDFQFKFSGSLNLGEWFLYSVSLPPGQHGTIQFGITESVGPRKWAHSVFTFSLFNSSQALFAEQHAHKLLPTTLLFILTNWQYPRNTLWVVKRVFEIEGIPFLVMLPPAWQCSGSVTVSHVWSHQAAGTIWAQTSDHRWSFN